MKRSGFARKVYERAPAAPLRAIKRAPNYAGATTGPAPKDPADRNQALRDLARDEDCTVRRNGGMCSCHPSTTVWAHPNSLGDRKGMGYKGDDCSGVFAGHECHVYLDTSGASDVPMLFRLAQARTKARLIEIAESKTAKPWKVKAARAALQQLEVRDGTRV